MKKIVIFVVFVSMLALMSGCGNENDLDNNGKKAYPAFVSKCVFEDEEDEWFNYFCMELQKKDREKKSVVDNYKFDDTATYVFDGVNIKYKKLDNYYIPIYDKNNKEVDKTEAAFPSLSVSTVYRDEIKAINKFFNEKKFSKKINIEDLSGLEISKIKKETLVDMFNRAYSKDPVDLGEYLGLPFVAILSSVSNDGYVFQVGYYAEYGNIIKVNIEVIYDDGTYLSDLVNNKKADTEQEKLFNKLIKIEEFIISNQDFDISKFNEYDESLKMLSNVMKRITELNE